MATTSPPIDLSKAKLVGFPLAGEWVALNTPAEKVPSHGTDCFGQRYAFDFVRLNSSGHKFYDQPLWKHFLGRLPVGSFLAFDQPVLAAFSGTVIGIGDGWPDRKLINAFWEMARASLFAVPARQDDYRPLVGNYALISGWAGVALYAHLREGSLRVQAGDEVIEGQVIAVVGNSGNSTMPHLHFQVMSGPDPFTAEGVLCGFKNYERLTPRGWEQVATGVPSLMERIRVDAPADDV